MKAIIERSQDDGEVLVELKFQLFLFVPTPPGPKTVRKVLELYLERWPDRLQHYRATSVGASTSEWNPKSQETFFSSELPKLRVGRHWGYQFTDGKDTKSQQLQIHGFRPVTEPDSASFYRFDFAYDIDPQRVLEFCTEVLKVIPACIEGRLGYYFQGLPRRGAEESFGKILGLAKRYWAVDVRDFETTMYYVKDGIKGVSWGTIVGKELVAAHPKPIQQAREVAHATYEVNGNMLFLADEAPILGDVEAGESLAPYEQIALALKALQIPDHEEFVYGAGDWDEEATQAWLERFTSPTWKARVSGSGA